MITVEVVKRTAALAKIAVSDDGINTLADDLNELRGLADIAADTDLSAMDLTEEDEIAQLREDVVLPSLPRERVFQNTSGERDGYFVAME